MSWFKAGNCAALLLGGMAAALTAPAQAGVSVTKDFTGIWDQTRQESQGFVLQIVAQPGGRKAGVAYWFTYDDNGNSQWLLGQGPVSANQVQLDFVTVSGPTFLESSNPGVRNVQPWGSGVIEFSSCTAGTVSITPDGAPATAFGISRLADVFATDCSGGISDDIPANMDLVRLEIALEPTSGASPASGEVEFEAEPGRADFKVEIEDLPAGTYQLVVDGTPQGDIEVTSRNGGTEGELELRSPADAGHELLTFDPRGAVIEIASDGMVLLSSDAVPMDDGGPEQDLEIEISLTNEGVYPFAYGEAEFEQRSDRSEFSVEIEDVPAGEYTLMVGGQARGIIEVIELIGGGTEGELEFRNPAEAGKDPLDFDPRGQDIFVLEGDTAIFSAEFPGMPEDGDDTNGDGDNSDDRDDDSDSDSDNGDDGDDGNDAGDDGNADGTRLEIDVDLANEGVYPMGSGDARYRERADRVDFQVEIEDVPEGSYALRVGGVERGIIDVTATAGEVEGEIEFRDPVEPGKELLDFDPRGELVEVLEGDTLIFSVEFPADPTTGEPDGTDGDNGGNDDGSDDDSDSDSDDSDSDSDSDDSDSDSDSDDNNGGDDNNDPEELEIQVEMDNTGADSDASGEARFEVESDRRDFKVEVEDLADGDYDLVVGGVIEGIIEVSGGEGELEFRDPPEPGKLPLVFDPRGQTISVEQGGEVFLTVDFPS
ncbi:MAG: hypothetical protein QNJ40_10295 [Xanthomonadales bacterium]|nr:hypothetical protein [Xanthomonadales bacterium]